MGGSVRLLHLLWGVLLPRSFAFGFFVLQIPGKTGPKNKALRDVFADLCCWKSSSQVELGSFFH